MADFKIKSTAGTGNLTLLQSQDQSGSDYAIKIGDSGASTLTNATLTSPTLTTPNLGTPSAITLTNATFPSTHPNLTIARVGWESTLIGTTEVVVADYYSWQNTKADSTVWVEITFPVGVSVYDGNSIMRYALYHLYYNTSQVSDGATSGFGTKISSWYFGRETVSSINASRYGYGTLTLAGKFTSSSTVGTNYYVGLSVDSDSGYTKAQTYGTLTGSISSGTLIKILEQ